jgi:hypothetical protein
VAGPKRGLRPWVVTGGSCTDGGGLSVDGFCAWWRPRAVVRGECFEREKGIRWMPWHQEAMKDVARCEKPWGAASRL